MKVNINDIEDIVIAKIEIDKNNPEIEGRSPLNEFINEYCKINWLFMYNDISIPFEIKTIFNNQYIFYSCENENTKKLFFEFLNKIKNNINNLNEISNTTILNSGLKDNTIYVIKNNKYYSAKN